MPHRETRCFLPRGAVGPSALLPSSPLHSPVTFGSLQLSFAVGCARGLVMDSDLDAFSQYPSHDSIATPVARLIAETSGAARGFLSYYHVLPSPHPRGVIDLWVLLLVFQRSRAYRAHGRSPVNSLMVCLWQEGKTNLSHDGLNPAHVPCWWVNNPTLPLGCGREARKSRHRRIKKPRRFERLAATSQLSLW